MKKLIYTLTAIATLAFAAGCANELDGPNPVKGEFVETEFTVALDDAVSTKAINNDGKLVNKLTICAFKNDGTYLPDLNEANGNFVIEDVDVTGTKAQFSVKAKLVRNYPYKLAFFAFKEGAPYTLSEVNDKPIITMTDANANANDESLDAFFYVTDDDHPVVLDPDAVGGLSKTFTLTRPLAQINILSDHADWTAASTTGILAGLKSSVSIAKAPNVLNLVDGTVSGEATLAFEETIAPEGTINVAAPGATAVNANYVAMAYVLSSATANPVNLTFSVSSDDTNFAGFTRTVNNVPNKRNFRTNLHGDLFTVTGDFTVELDGAWGGNDDNQSINIPTPTITNPTSVPSEITATLPTITAGNNVTTSVAAGPLYFGIGDDDTDSNGDITYSSSNLGVGTIDNKGVFTPVGAGNTNITITQAAGTATKAVGDPRAEITIVFHVTVEGPAEYHVTVSGTPEHGSVAIKNEAGDAAFTKGIEGAKFTVVTTPHENYELDELTVTDETGALTPEDGKYTIRTSDVTVSATFKAVEVAPTTYDITFSAGANGGFSDIKLNGEAATLSENKLAAQKDAVITFKVAPETGYEVDAVTVGGTPITPVSEVYTYTVGETAATISATFKEEEVATPVLQSIAISGQTAAFTVGDKFAFGGTVTASYDSGDPKVVTENLTYTINGDAATPGMTDITYAMNGKNVVVSYTEGDVTKSATAYTITVNKKSRAGLAINNPGTLYADSSYGALTLTGTISGDNVEFVSTDDEVAMADATALITGKAGSATITATVAENGDYKEEEVSIILTVNELISRGSAFKFAKTKDTTAEDNDSYTIPALEGTVSGDVVTYSVEDDNVIELTTEGVVQALMAGTTTVTASVQRNGNYKEENTSFTLTVTAAAGGSEPQNRPSYAFSAASVTATIGETAPTYPTLNGTVTEDIPVYSSTNESVATVNESTGAITLVGKGTTIIKASVAAHDGYTAQEVSYTLNVKAWTLVTDASSLKANDQIVLIGESGGKYYVNDAASSSSYLSASEISINNNTITSFGTVDKQVISLSKSGEYWIMSIGGESLKATSSKTSLSTSTSNGTETWTISIAGDDNKATIANTAVPSGKTSNDIKFNASASPKRFSNYIDNTSMSSPFIYRLEQ